MKRLLALLILMLSLAIPALAQTPEPTAAATDAATAPAPTPETPVIDDEPAPAIPPIPAPLYATVVNRLVDFILLLVGFGGGYVLIKAWKNPEQGKQLVTFGLAVLEFGTKLTPTTADDLAIKRLTDEWAKILAPVIEASVQATMQSVIEVEKTKLREDANAQAANRAASSYSAFGIVPPQNSVDG